MTLASELRLNPREARAAFGALKAVAEAAGAPRAQASRLLEVAAGALDLGEEGAAIPAATPEQVAEVFPAPGARRALVDALILPACIEGEVSEAGEARVFAFARALGVRSPWVDLLPAIRRRRVLTVKRQLVRSSPDARRIFARTWAEEGFGGVFRAVLFVLGLHVDPALAARFRALAALPEGTLGRSFFDHLDSRGLAFPGEPKGIPEKMTHHDLMHVLNGYGTDAAGECEIAGFYTAFCPGEAFTFVVTALTSFHMGMPVSPAAVTPTRGAFDPARVLAAFLRGRRLRVDVMGPWDYWALMPLPIAEARARLGIGEATESGGPVAPETAQPT